MWTSEIFSASVSFERFKVGGLSSIPGNVKLFLSPGDKAGIHLSNSLYNVNYFVKSFFLSSSSLNLPSPRICNSF